MTSAVQWLEKQLSVTFKEMYAEEFYLAKAMEEDTISKLKERIDDLENQIIKSIKQPKI
jgi:hypothetical protein